MQTFIAWTYLPAFLIGGNAIAILMVEHQASKICLVGLVLVLILASFVSEKLHPYDAEFNRDRLDTGRDRWHALVNEGSNVLGWLMFPWVAHELVLMPIWPGSWPLAAQLILAILLADIGITLAHYASHHYSALWKLHAVHHSVERMYGFNGLMKHPLHQFVETAAGVLPLLLIGVPQDVLALLIVAVVIQLLLQHSNVNYHCGPFIYLLAINQIHRFHHLSSAKEGNVNFGLFTTLTDRLLGTAYFDPKRRIGVKDLGIANEPDFPRSYLRQLLYPFYRRSE